MSEEDEIAAWLRGQAEADLAAAKAATPGPWSPEEPLLADVVTSALLGRVADCSVGTGYRPQSLADARHIGLHDPLTEAARAESVLAVLKFYGVAVTVAEAGAGPGKAAEVLRLVIRDLACGYRHREGYRPEWKP